MLAALMARIQQKDTGYEGLYKVCSPTPQSLQACMSSSILINKYLNRDQQMHKEKLQLAKAFKRVDIAQKELHNLRDDVASIRQRKWVPNVTPEVPLCHTRSAPLSMLN